MMIKKSLFLIVLLTFIDLGAFASASDRIVEFGDNVPTVEELRAALGVGSSQRIIEFTPQSSQPSLPPSYAATPSVQQVAPQQTVSGSIDIAPVPQQRGLSIPIQFALNSDEVLPNFYPHISQIAVVLTEDPNLRLHIIGHTDTSGSSQYNLDLSKRRAQQVWSMLVNWHNISPNRLSTDGYGENQPRFSGGYEYRNRRVEFIVVR